MIRVEIQDDIVISGDDHKEGERGQADKENDDVLLADPHFQIFEEIDLLVCGLGCGQIIGKRRGHLLIDGTACAAVVQVLFDRSIRLGAVQAIDVVGQQIFCDITFHVHPSISSMIFCFAR